MLIYNYSIVFYLSFTFFISLLLLLLKLLTSNLANIAVHLLVLRCLVLRIVIRFNFDLTLYLILLIMTDHILLLRLLLVELNGLILLLNISRMNRNHVLLKRPILKYQSSNTIRLLETMIIHNLLLLNWY